MNRLPSQHRLYYFTAILMAPGLWVIKIFGIDFCQACGKLKRLRWPIMSSSMFCREDCATEFALAGESRSVPLLMRMAGRRRRW